MIILNATLTTTTTPALSETPYTLLETMLSIFGFSLGSLANLIDGNISTNGVHADTAAVGSYIRTDFGGTPISVGKVRAYANGAGCVVVFKVQYSDNGIAWTDASGTVDMNGAAGWYELTWTYTEAHRYWQMYKTNGATPGNYISEVEYYQYV